MLVLQFIYKGTVSVPRSQLPLLLESAISMKIKGIITNQITVLLPNY